MSIQPMEALLEDDDLINIGVGLASIQGTEGWQLFMQLLAKYEQDTALLGLRDTDKPREYYIGFADALASIRKVTETLVGEARAAAEAKAAQDRTYAVPRFDSAVSGV